MSHRRVRSDGHRQASGRPAAGQRQASSRQAIGRQSAGHHTCRACSPRKPCSSRAHVSARPSAPIRQCGSSACDPTDGNPEAITNQEAARRQLRGYLEVANSHQQVNQESIRSQSRSHQGLITRDAYLAGHKGEQPSPRRLLCNREVSACKCHRSERWRSQPQSATIGRHSARSAIECNQTHSAIYSSATRHPQPAIGTDQHCHQPHGRRPPSSEGWMEGATHLVGRSPQLGIARAKLSAGRLVDAT